MTATATVVACISGYFDPLHVGHLEYISRSKALTGPGGKLIVIVNNDHQAFLKKGRSFMPAKERVLILKALRDVDEVVESIDTDRTVCETIRHIHVEHGITHFANGGDQFNTGSPEAPVCEELGIHLVDSLGDKIQSSSWLTGLKKN